MQPFTEDVIHIIKSIPPGKVATYGQIAALAGNPRGARQVSRILHSMSRKYDLPWYRVISSTGKISIKDPEGAELQKAKLVHEDVNVEGMNSVNLKRYQWDGEIEL